MWKSTSESRGVRAGKTEMGKEKKGSKEGKGGGEKEKGGGGGQSSQRTCYK